MQRPETNLKYRRYSMVTPTVAPTHPAFPLTTLQGHLVDGNHLKLPKTTIHVMAINPSNKICPCKQIGEGITDANGAYSIKLPWVKMKDRKIEFSIFKKTDEGTKFDYKKAKIDTTTYSEEFKVPEMVASELTYIPHEEFNLHYTFDILKAAIPSALKAVGLMIKEKVGKFINYVFTSVDEVVEKLGKPCELSLKNSEDFFTKGVCPIHLRKTNENDLFLGEINWDGYAFDQNRDGTEQVEGLPSAKIYFRKIGNKLTIEKYSYQFRGKDEVMVSKNDKNFIEDLRKINCAGLVYGELVYHLFLGHVLPMSHRDLMINFLDPSHGLGKLLLSFTKFLRTITDNLGKTAISGDNGILGTSCLNSDSIIKIMSEISVCPFSAKPRKDGELNQLMQLHRKNIAEGVKDYFDNHWDEITQHWDEVHAFFSELFRTSSEYKPFQGVTDLSQWHDISDFENESYPNLPPRKEYGGILRSIRPIATDPGKPHEHDREFIQNYCTWFISQVTGWHSFIHVKGQFPYGLDPRSFPIRLENYGEGQYGGVTIPTAINQTKIGETLEDFKFSEYALVNNPNGDIYQPIIDAILASAKDYFKLAFDIYSIMYSTVI